MKSFILNYKEIHIVFICITGSWLASLASGYFLNPAIFGFIFTPIFFLSAFLSTLIFSSIPIIKLFKKHHRNKKMLISSFVCASLIFIQFSGFLPGASSAVEYRLKQFSEPEYQVISTKVEKTYEEIGSDVISFGVGNRGYEEFLAQLKKEHDIFTISSFPIDVFRDEDSIRIEWASGLTGGFEVIIYDGLNLPTWIENYDPVHIYENVAFYYKS